MNAFVVSTFALCIAGQLAAANYGGSQSGGYQRKMAPSPQMYQAATSGYGQQQSGYGQQQSGYGQEQQASYGAAKSSGYGQQASGHAKPAARYEEPYYPPMPFAWGYDINDGYGGAQYHKENGDEYGKRTGSYGYTDAYGVYRQVDYVADEHGFRATIKTNEPGTANESPADVELHAYEPPSNYYAGNSYGSGSSNSGSGYSTGSGYSSGAGKSSGYGSAAATSMSAYSAPTASSGYQGASSNYQSSGRQSYGSAPRVASQGYQQRSAAGYGASSAGGQYGTGNGYMQKSAGSAY